MPITTTQVTGNINLPDGSAMVGSFVRFRLTSFDTDAIDNITVHPYTVSAYLDAASFLDVSLWPNERGVRATEYEVTLGASDGRNIYEYRLNNITIPDTGIADFDDLQRGEIVAPPVVNFQQTLTIPAGKVTADLTDFQCMIYMADLEATFWDTVDPDGGNVRVYAADGVTLIPHDVTSLFPERKLGLIVAKTSISAVVDTTLVVRLEDAGVARLPDADPNGMHAVYSNCSFVQMYPDLTNRTGAVYTSNIAGVADYSEWIRQDYNALTGSPHQGIATDGTSFISIDTNALRLSGADFVPTVTNLDPLGDTGIAGVDHVGDGCIIGSELFVPVEQYPNSPYNNQHIAVFDVATLAFKRSYDISAQSHEVSSIAFDGTVLWITDYTVSSTLHKYTTSGSYLGAVTLSSGISGMQGIEYVDGVFYVADGGENVYAVQPDGTNLGVIYHDYHSGSNEGMAYHAPNLYLLDGGGDLVTLTKDDAHFDWRKIHYGTATIDMPSTQTWSMTASVFWTDPTGDKQQKFLSMESTSDSSRASLLYDDGPDVMGIWDSTDDWLHSTINPIYNQTMILAHSNDGSLERKLFVDGNVWADAQISARPTGSGNRAVINDSSGEAYYNHVVFRDTYMGDAWAAAEAENRINHSTFYTFGAVP